MLPTELLEKPIFQMTGGEFIQLLQQSQPAQQNHSDDYSNGEFISGVSGLAKFLGCGRTKAAKLRASRILEDATYYVGNRLFFQKEKVKEILKNQ